MKTRRFCSSYWVSRKVVGMSGLSSGLSWQNRVIWNFSFAMGFYASWLMITFAQLYLTILVVQYRWSWVIFTIVHWVDILGSGSWWRLCVQGSFGKVWVRVWNSLSKIVLFVRLTNTLLSDLLGCCNRWKTQQNRLSMWQWILSLIYLLVHVDMMLFLALSTDFHVYVVL